MWGISSCLPMSIFHFSLKMADAQRIQDWLEQSNFGEELTGRLSGDGEGMVSPVSGLYSWFPLGLEIRENLGKWEGIFQSGKSQGILSRLEKSGNFTQNTGKIGKKLYWKIEKNTGKVREICQPVIEKTLQVWYHTLNKKRTLKILENCKKYWKSQRNLSVQ